VTATHRPVVILTSNRSRELSEALRPALFCICGSIIRRSRRRLEIVRLKVPGISANVWPESRAFHANRAYDAARESTGRRRDTGLGDGAGGLDATQLDAELVDETLGCFLKDEADLRTFRMGSTTRACAAMATALP
jgi:hypothetical protein